MTRAYIRGIAARLDHYSIPEPNSGCYLWLGKLSDRGYGRINVDGKDQQAHRVAWSEEHGPIPPGIVIRHKCDVPCCVRLDHLVDGTHQDNMDDRRRRRRIYTPKVTAEVAAAIRADSRNDEDTAKAFGISRAHVFDIRAGRRWPLCGDANESTTDRVEPRP